MSWFQIDVDASDVNGEVINCKRKGVGRIWREHVLKKKKKTKKKFPASMSLGQWRIQMELI